MKENKIFVSGHFNILHVGHLRLLRFARECGLHLIVGVESDKIAGKAAYIPEAMRLEGIKSISWIDEAFVFDEPVTEVIKRLQPNVVVKGKEHEFSDNPEKSELEKLGGKLIFSSGESLFSSIDLIRNEISFAETNSIKMPNEYISRNKLDVAGLTALVKKIPKLRVCIIGDLIIDEYITCEALGMSQEDPTIVVTPVDHVKFIGGAGVVAAHASGLGAHVNFISIVGSDSLTEYATNKLTEYGVIHRLIVDSTRPTTLKQRFRSKGKTLLRVSHLHQHPISQDLQTKIFAEVEDCLDACDLLVFSDFNYGCLPQPMVDKIIEKAKQKGVILAADSQSSSQVGDVSRFKGMDILTPTEHEARLSTRNQQDGLVILAEELRKKANAANVFLKMGVEGMLIHAGTEEAWLTDRISALNSAPKDVSGAGDSLLITGSMAMACGGTIWQAALLGSLAAAIQVGRVGNIPIKTEEILKVLQKT